MAPYEVAVIIPCRNAADVLPDQLGSLTRQRCSLRWEVIVVDDGSTDHGVRVARSFAGRIPALRVATISDGTGAAAVRNAGAALTRAPSLLFVDADDAVEPCYVEALGLALREHSLVCALVDFERLNGREAAARSPRPRATKPHRMFNFLPHAGAGGLGVRRELFLAMGGFDPTLPWLHDADLCWRIQLQTGEGLHLVEEAVELVRLRTDLPGLYRQGVSNGRDGIRLRRRYAAHGVPWTPWSRHLRQWGKTARALRRCHTIAGRTEFAWRLGKQVGRLQGLVTAGR
jgi:glycosyltransferase involved in cell wall biosynthesis